MSEKELFSIIRSKPAEGGDDWFEVICDVARTYDYLEEAQEAINEFCKKVVYQISSYEGKLDLPDSMIASHSEILRLRAKYSLADNEIRTSIVKGLEELAKHASAGNDHYIVYETLMKAAKFVRMRSKDPLIQAEEEWKKEFSKRAATMKTLLSHASEDDIPTPETKDDGCFLCGEIDDRAETDEVIENDRIITSNTKPTEPPPLPNGWRSGTYADDELRSVWLKNDRIATRVELFDDGDVVIAHRNDRINVDAAVLRHLLGLTAPAADVRTAVEILQREKERRGWCDSAELDEALALLTGKGAP